MFILALDPLAKGIEGVGNITPTPKPQVKKPRVVSINKVYIYIPMNA